MDYSWEQKPSAKHCLARLERLLEKVRKTVQSKSDLQFLEKYRCDFEISQPNLLVGGEMKKYQLEALEWMISLAAQSSNGILADDMGLGKTIQAIAYLAYLKEENGILGKHLVVCPKSVAGNWQRQINKWFPSAKVALMITTHQTRQKFLSEVLRPKKFDILITNFQGAKISAFALSRIKWQTLIIDEAHKIKNNQSKNFIILNELKTTFRLLLTGTPLNNNLKELWCLMNFIMPEIFQDEELFHEIEENTNAFEGSEEEKLKYQCQVAKYFHEIINPFFKRRTKKELDLGLPEKIEMTLFVPLSKLQLRLYRNFLRYGNVYGDSKPSNFNIMTPRKICQHPFLFPDLAQQDQSTEEDLISSCGKLNVLDKLLKKLIAQKHKILIFSQFVVMLDILQDYCRIRSYNFCRIDGNSALEERDDMIKKFYDDPNYPIFLLSTRAGGLGLNLVAADRVIIYDIDWNPQNDMQATDRAYRIGQTKTVLVYRLITEHSIEERMLELQKYKLIWDELVIQRGAVFGKKKEDPFANMNYNNLSKLGKGDIFHLEPEENDQTIQEILSLGAQKNRQKQTQIREKLKKTIEMGSKINPFIEQKEEDIEYDTNEQQDVFVQRRNYENDKRERSKFERSRFLPPFKFYIQPQLIKDIEFQIYMETKREKKNQNKKLLQLLHEKLQEAQSKGRFHNWSQLEFDKFVEAHEKYYKTDYLQISQFIGSKTEEETQIYSSYFFEKAPNNERLIDTLRQIQRRQSKLKMSKNNNNNSSESNVRQISTSENSIVDNSKVKDDSKSNNSNETESKAIKKRSKEQIELERLQRERLKLEKQELRKKQKEEREKKRQEEIQRREYAKIKRQEDSKLKQEAKKAKQEQRRLRNQERLVKKQAQLQQRQRKKLEQESKKKLQQAQKLKKESDKNSKGIDKEKSSSKVSEKTDKNKEDDQSPTRTKKQRKISQPKLPIVTIISSD